MLVAFLNQTLIWMNRILDWQLVITIHWFMIGEKIMHLQIFSQL